MCNYKYLLHYSNFNAKVSSFYNFLSP